MRVFDDIWAFLRVTTVLLKCLDPHPRKLATFRLLVKKVSFLKWSLLVKKGSKCRQKRHPFVFYSFFPKENVIRLSLQIPKEWWHETLSSFVCESKSRLPPRFLGENWPSEKSGWRFCTCKNTCLKVSKSDTYLCFALFFPKKTWIRFSANSQISDDTKNVKNVSLLVRKMKKSC